MSIGQRDYSVLLLLGQRRLASRGFGRETASFLSEGLEKSGEFTLLRLLQSSHRAVNHCRVLRENLGHQLLALLCQLRVACPTVGRTCLSFGEAAFREPVHQKG